MADVELAAGEHVTRDYQSRGKPGAADEEIRLVKAARHGDRAAFAQLHQRHAPMVHGIALARLPVADAPDLVQEVFLHALGRMHQMRDDASFAPWLATIARNLVVEFHRRRRLRTHEELTDRPERPDLPAHDDHNQAQQLLEAIRSLPDAHAETLVLRLVEGLTGPQIAASLGLTHGSVRVNLHRGMHMLRERLARMNIALEEAP